MLPCHRTHNVRAATQSRRALQVLLEQCRSLGLSVARYRSSIPSARLLSSSAGAADGGAKPGGRNMQKAGKMFGTFASRFGSMVNGGQSPGPLGSTGKRLALEQPEGAHPVRRPRPVLSL